MKELAHLLKKLQTDPAQASRMGPPKNFEVLGRAVPALRAPLMLVPVLGRGPCVRVVRRPRLANAPGICALRLPPIKLQGSHRFL